MRACERRVGSVRIGWPRAASARVARVAHAPLVQPVEGSAVGAVERDLHLVLEQKVVLARRREAAIEQPHANQRPVTHGVARDVFAALKTGAAVLRDGVREA